MTCLNIEDVAGRYRNASGEDLYMDYSKRNIQGEEIYNISSKEKNLNVLVMILKFAHL